MNKQTKELLEQSILEHFSLVSEDFEMVVKAEDEKKKEKVLFLKKDAPISKDSSRAIQEKKSSVRDTPEEEKREDEEKQKSRSNEKKRSNSPAVSTNKDKNKEKPLNLVSPLKESKKNTNESVDREISKSMSKLTSKISRDVGSDSDSNSRRSTNKRQQDKRNESGSESESIKSSSSRRNGHSSSSSKISSNASKKSSVEKEEQNMVTRAKKNKKFLRQYNDKVRRDLSNLETLEESESDDEDFQVEESQTEDRHQTGHFLNSGAEDDDDSEGDSEGDSEEDEPSAADLAFIADDDDEEDSSESEGDTRSRNKKGLSNGSLKKKHVKDDDEDDDDDSDRNEKDRHRHRNDRKTSNQKNHKLERLESGKKRLLSRKENPKDKMDCSDEEPSGRKKNNLTKGSQNNGHKRRKIEEKGKYSKQDPSSDEEEDEKPEAGEEEEENSDDGGDREEHIDRVLCISDEEFKKLMTLPIGSNKLEQLKEMFKKYFVHQAGTILKPDMLSDLKAVAQKKKAKGVQDKHNQEQKAVDLLNRIDNENEKILNELKQSVKNDKSFTEILQYLALGIRLDGNPLVEEKVAKEIENLIKKNKKKGKNSDEDEDEDDENQGEEDEEDESGNSNSSTIVCSLSGRSIKKEDAYFLTVKFDPRKFKPNQKQQKDHVELNVDNCYVPLIRYIFTLLHLPTLIQGRFLSWYSNNTKKFDDPEDMREVMSQLLLGSSSTHPLTSLTKAYTDSVVYIKNYLSNKSSEQKRAREWKQKNPSGIEIEENDNDNKIK